jgi:Ca2+-binding RTX toxin-like protein
MSIHTEPGGRRALAAVVAAGACLTATLGFAADQAGAAPTRVQAQVQAGTLQITGTARADNIGLRLALGAPTTLQVDVGGDGTPDFSFETATFSAINVRAGDGADRITGSAGLAPLGQLRIDGGRGKDFLVGGDGDDVLIGDGGNDTVFGGDGNDLLLGDRGNDTVSGGRGNDVVFLDRGDDRFTWNPGDGDDSVEGQAGNDVLGFNGANLPELMDVTSNGPRVRLFRNVANINMDLQGVERLELNALAGSDLITVGDLTGTDLKTADINLAGGDGAGDAQADTVITEGTPRDDHVRVARSGAQVLTSGLAAETRIAGSEAANDTLIVNTLAGNDDVTVAPDVADLIRSQVDLGAGE